MGKDNHHTASVNECGRVGRKRLGYDHDAGCAMLACSFAVQCVYGKKNGSGKIKRTVRRFWATPKTMPLG
jgi:hypothetical protein